MEAILKCNAYTTTSLYGITKYNLEISVTTLEKPAVIVKLRVYCRSLENGVTFLPSKEMKW